MLFKCLKNYYTLSICFFISSLLFMAPYSFNCFKKNTKDLTFQQHIFNRLTWFFLFLGPCEAAWGPTRLHRPAEHLRHQVLLHGSEPRRGRKIVNVVYVFGAFSTYVIFVLRAIFIKFGAFFVQRHYFRAFLSIFLLNGGFFSVLLSN